jgi:hypothetical protein
MAPADDTFGENIPGDQPALRGLSLADYIERQFAEMAGGWTR